LAKPDPKRELEELEAVCSALAHAARRHMLLVVWFRGGAMSAGDIAARFSHSWPTTSRHLRVLEDAGLLAQEKDGRTRLYRVRTDKLEVLRRWLAWFDGAHENDEGGTDTSPIPPSKKRRKSSG
jgi:DNA-binding transcriptional ArsR family regulator